MKNWEFNNHSWLTRNLPRAGPFPAINYSSLSESSLLKQRYDAATRKHPKFVFFGETGKGKSTLIQAIIKNIFNIRVPLPRTDSRTTLCPFEITILPGTSFSANIRVEADTDYQKIRGIINQVSTNPTEKTEEAKACAWILNRLNPQIEVPEAISTQFAAQFKQQANAMVNYLRRFEAPLDFSISNKELLQNTNTEDLLFDINLAKHASSPWPKIVKIQITVPQKEFSLKFNNMNGISFIDSRGLGNNEVDGNQVLIPQQELITSDSIIIFVDGYANVSYIPTHLIPQFIQKCPGIACRYALLLSAAKYDDQRSARGLRFATSSEALKDRAETRANSLQNSLKAPHPLPPTIAFDPIHPENLVFTQLEVNSWEQWLQTAWNNLASSYAEITKTQYDLNIGMDLQPLRNAINSWPASILEDWLNNFFKIFHNYAPSSVNATMIRYGDWIDMHLDFQNALIDALSVYLFDSGIQLKLPNSASVTFLTQQLAASVSSMTNSAWIALATADTYESSQSEYGRGKGYMKRVASIWRDSFNEAVQVMRKTVEDALNDLFLAVAAVTIEEKFNSLTV